jgi:hypothetical protein
MNATITLEGPVPYGREQFELQATIQTADGKKKCLKWSIHTHIQDAIEYRDRFNANAEQVSS